MEPVPLFFWKSSAGVEPVREWLYTLPRDEQRAVGRDLAKMQFLWVRDVTAFPRVATGLWEVRAALSGRRMARFLIADHDGRLIALSVVFGRTRKPPDADLEFARRRLNQVTERGKKRNSRVGSTFESWLDEQGIREEATAAAVKCVIAKQLAFAMKRHRLSKPRVAELMQTSRSEVDGLLDPDNSSATLETLMRAAKVVGGQLRLELV